MKNQIDGRVRARIENHGEPSDITQLCLDDLIIHNFTPGICEEIRNLPNLEFVTLNRCRLKSLSDFPYL